MNLIVDLYAKVVVAVFGFVAPTVTLLVGVLSERIKSIRDSKKKFESQSESINNALLEEFNASLKSLSTDVARDLMPSLLKSIKKAQHDYKKRIVRLNRELRFLNIKKRIFWIFMFLFIALLLIALYYYFTDVDCNYNYLTFYGVPIVPSLPLLLSNIAFLWAISRIWKLAKIVLEHKYTEATTPTNIKQNE